MEDLEYRIKLHNLRQSKNYTEPILSSLSTKKSYKTTVLLTKKVADKVKDKVTINRQSRYKQFLKETMPHTDLEMKFRTHGKQKMLSRQRGTLLTGGGGKGGWIRKLVNSITGNPLE